MLLGTSWEQIENKKTLKNPLPTSKTQMKKTRHFSMHVEPSRWLEEIFVSRNHLLSFFNLS